MARRVWLVILFAAVVCAFDAARAQSCSPRPGDDAAVVETIRTMFAAASADDLDKFHTVAAPGFYMYDNGHRFDGDEIMKLIVAQHAKGAKYVWTVTQPDVHVTCDVAWIAYVNDGSVQQSGDAPAVPMKWLESAVLHREGKAWKVVFVHSTRAAQ